MEALAELDGQTAWRPASPQQTTPGSGAKDRGGETMFWQTVVLHDWRLRSKTPCSSGWNVNRHCRHFSSKPHVFGRDNNPETLFSQPWKESVTTREAWRGFTLLIFAFCFFPVAEKLEKKDEDSLEKTKTSSGDGAPKWQMSAPCRCERVLKKVKHIGTLQTSKHPEGGLTKPWCADRGLGNCWSGVSPSNLQIAICGHIFCTSASCAATPWS